ncbi:MAG: lipid-A-disaccharide synthase [Gammaproteobacteria bacterium]|nr:lipid-A-disaccharide synthase [Gammaproteobacteria bacterium]
MLNINKQIMIIAGEASGDQRGAEVATALLAREPNLKLYGIGGEHMRAAGVECLIDVSQLAVMGFVEVIVHLPRIMRIFKSTKNLLIERKPDLLILVDYPGFNLRLAKIAKKLGIKVLFYISPQVWAWRQHRVKKIAQVVDHMAVIFPFEKQFYQDHNVPVSYVGHPLTQKLKNKISQADARTKLDITSQQKMIALLPGSREGEINRILPELIKSTELISAKISNCIFYLAIASTIPTDTIRKCIAASNSDIRIARDKTYDIISAADVVLTASGTATLETALLNKPMVIVYKVSSLTAFIVRKMIKIPYVSLCNIVAGEQVVVELLQDDATAENIAQETLHILTDETYREQMKEKLSHIEDKLGDLEAADNVANIALSML